MNATEKHRQHLESARRKLEEVALSYARMKTMGRYIENGAEHIVGPRDVKDYEIMFAGNLQRAHWTSWPNCHRLRFPKGCRNDDA